MRNAAVEFRHKVAFFSLQMRSDKLLTKWLSLEVEVSYDKIEAGNLTPEELVRLNDSVRRWEGDAGSLIWLVDTPNLTISGLVARCKKLKAEGAELFLIDNLHRIAIGPKARAFCHNREQELAYIMRRLKTLAYEVDAPVIVVAQMSRAAATHGMYSRPKLGHLRDSGAIENEADVVVLLYRHEYYGMSEDEEGNSTHNMAELIVAKNNFGKTETANVRFMTEYGLFKDIEHDEYTPEPTHTAPGNIREAPVPFPKGTIRLGSRLNRDFGEPPL